MSTSFTSIIDSPIGKLSLSFENNQLIKIEFGKKNKSKSQQNSSLVKQVQNELKKYFENSNYQLQISYLLKVTPFQQKVLIAMSKIPVGQVKTYGELAQELKSAPRAIGQACRNNPLPLIFPCHRVVAKEGLGGFSGARGGKKLEIKTWLLKHEKAVINHSNLSATSISVTGPAIYTATASGLFVTYLS